jgi:hypothetical protein
MAENPIKLFVSRAERYPQPTEADMIQGGARAALAAIPVIGGTVTEVLSMVLAPSVSCRRDVWFKELADGLDQLEAKVEGSEPRGEARREEAARMNSGPRRQLVGHQFSRLFDPRRVCVAVALCFAFP